MSVNSEEMALPSCSSGLPPPKRLASAAGKNAQVTASLKPRVANVRREANMRFCKGVSTGLAMAWGLGNSA